jgi:hypothetical protein
MKHLSQEQIVLHYYSDTENEGEVRGHLGECSACGDEFEHVRLLLQYIEPTEVPEPAPVFEEKMWLRVRDRLPEKRLGFRQWLASPPRWAIAGVVTLLLVGAFVAGRFWPRHEVVPPTAQNPATGGPQRVVLVAVGDHLERSQMLLVEIMNRDAKGTVDLSSEQQQARDLLDANHLYRVSAQQAGDPQVAHLLDDLGRVLTEIANSPADLSAADLQQIRGLIQSDNLLFKVRVVGSEVNSRVQRQQQRADSANQRL